MRLRVITFEVKFINFRLSFHGSVYFLFEINTFNLFFRKMFFTISQHLECLKSPASVLEAGGFVCALSGLVGLVAVSLVLMRQRSGVPFSFSLNDGQGVHLSVLPAVLEIPRLSLVTKVTGLGWIFIALEEY